jgi:hypothetical protein
MTLLYINGDSHSAAAEAIVPCAFAEDDSKYFYMGRAPHPDNARVAWGTELANLLKCKLHLDAESASSNTRIIRTTKKWLNGRGPRDILIVIQWSTWEREEWLIDDTYYQVNGSGIDMVPDSHKEQYKEYIANLSWLYKTQQAHQEIYEFHQWLDQGGFKHVFFNGNSHFGKIADQKYWGPSYIGPYDQHATYDSILRSNGFITVTPNSYHYGADAHAFWAKYMLKYILANDLI